MKTIKKGKKNLANPPELAQILVTILPSKENTVQRESEIKGIWGLYSI